MLSPEGHGDFEDGWTFRLLYFSPIDHNRGDDQNVTF